MFVRNILLIVGFTALLAGGVLTAIWLTAAPRGDNAAAQAQVPRQSILIAARPITTGTLLRPEDIAWKDVAATDVLPSNLVKNRVTDADYIGAVARRDFAAGEALVSASIVKRNERGFLAAVLSPGMRAVSIAVDAPQSSSGLILPGDHVDVILTQSATNDPSNPINEPVGETVLHDLRVIAVDQSLSASPAAAPVNATLVGPAASRIPKTVTLEVSERDAEKLFVAAALGKLDLAVRALEAPHAGPSGAQAADQPVWGSDVSAALRSLHRQAPAREPVGPAQIAAKPPVQSRAEPVPTRIEVMHGPKTEIR